MTHRKEHTHEESRQTTTPGSSNAAEVCGPVPGTVMVPEYASVIARLAYVWGWPLVNMHNRREMFRKMPEHCLRWRRAHGAAQPAGHVYGLRGSAATPCRASQPGCRLWLWNLLAGPRPPSSCRCRISATASGSYALYDQRTDEFAQIGKQYGTEPGFYLVVGPDWRGKAPEGIAGVIKLATAMGVIAPRVFMDDTAEDRAAIQPLISQITMYPLSEFDGKMKTVDWKNIPSLPSPASSGGEMKWVQPGKFFDQLGAVLDEVPPLPGEESLYAQFRALLATAANDPAVKAAITQAAETNRNRGGGPALLLQERRRAAAGQLDARFQRRGLRDGLSHRLAMAKSNIFVNRNEETVYFYQYRDGAGQRLNGANRYTLTFKKGALPPVQGFWSLTMYNQEHFFNVNDLGRYSLGTKNKTLQYADDGSLTIYVQHDKPADNLVSNWLPSPDGDFAMTIRCYWPDEVLQNGDWLAPVVEKVK